MFTTLLAMVFRVKFKLGKLPNLILPFKYVHLYMCLSGGVVFGRLTKAETSPFRALGRR